MANFPSSLCFKNLPTSSLSLRSTHSLDTLDTATMTLQAIYEGFLARPEPEMLAEQASLHYITTTTTHNGPDNIIKHLQAVRRALDKKSQVTLSAIEDTNSLCLEIETTLLFTSGGGPYLLSLDDNFVVDQTVTIPMVR